MLLQKSWKGCVLFMSLISEWHGAISVVLLLTTLCNANVNMYLWLSCGGDITFVHYIFNPTVCIQLSLQLHGAMDPLFCFADSFVTPFNNLAYIFHTSVAHLNCISVKYFILISDFGKCLSNKWKNIFATFLLLFKLNVMSKKIDFVEVGFNFYLKSYRFKYFYIMFFLILSNSCLLSSLKSVKPSSPYSPMLSYKFKFLQVYIFQRRCTCP